MPCIPFRFADGVSGIMTVGGPTYEIQAAGRIFGFELPHGCGLVRVDRKTGDELPKEPPKAFWDAIERWEAGGRQMDGQKCIAPRWCGRCRGLGVVDDPAVDPALQRKRSRFVVTCPACEGKKVTQ